jgi:hypothetical protein
VFIRSPKSTHSNLKDAHPISFMYYFLHYFNCFIQLTLISERVYEIIYRQDNVRIFFVKNTPHFLQHLAKPRIASPNLLLVNDDEPLKSGDVSQETGRLKIILEIREYCNYFSLEIRTATFTNDNGVSRPVLYVARLSNDYLRLFKF